MDAFQRTLKQNNMVNIVFSGIPISTNSIYKRGRGHSFYMTDEAKARKDRLCGSMLILLINVTV